MVDRDAPNCVDMSKWGGPFTDAEAECMKARGIRLIIVNTFGPHAPGQMQTAVRHGFLLEAYKYLYWAQSIDYQVRMAARACAGFPVRRLWLDAEDKPTARVFSNQPGVRAAHH